MLPGQGSSWLWAVPDIAQSCPIHHLALLIALPDITQPAAALFQTEQCSAWISTATVPNSAQFESALSLTELSLNQRCPELHFAWLSAVPDSVNNFSVSDYFNIFPFRHEDIANYKYFQTICQYAKRMHTVKTRLFSISFPQTVPLQITDLLNKYWNGADQLKNLCSVKTGVFENLRFPENAILVVQHGSGASNAWLKNIESLKLKLRGSFLGFS